MLVNVRSSPQKHIVVDDFAAPAEVESLLAEFELLRDALGAGQVLRGGTAVDSALKRNRNLWLDDHYRGRRAESATLALLRARLLCPPIRRALEETGDLLFAHWALANADATLLSVYGPGDYYGDHWDEYPSLTANLMVCSTPKRFAGGDFWLADDHVLHPDRPRHYTRLEFRAGRLVLFPARARHYVDVVTGEDLAFRDGRFSVQHWAQYVTRAT
ncbi:MAG: 2OG-Fe(II) oxygenase [Deltaproteobacteria bacterium]|nr:2OG-Fe(II) oxygenase [Deltaproteobacteria bacterium]